MDFPHSTILLILTFLIFSLPSSKPNSDYNTLVYKTCATQTFNDDHFFQSYSQTLASMFQQLIAQSSQSKFFKTKEFLNNNTSISCLFQCRKDITTQDCFTCVNSLPHMSNTLCSNSISARVQLNGCYIKYEQEKVLEITSNEELSDPSNSNLLHYKDCGVISSVTNYVEFRELMDEAFVELENGIVNSDGYYRVNYKGVQLMAQCEGDSETCECSQCVYAAVEVAKEKCGASISAQIYLDKCFISYIYKLNSYGNGNSIPGTRRNNSTEKLAAIIVGGAAAAFLGFLFLSFLNSRCKKDEYE
ncbi:hypothetical protein Lal_00047396 [Lupinus albus]|uniref:Putative Gnk2-like domain-containing protein n=1 Tax=Lupinus albus TaxID=3870 RepID=A0A6A5N8X7_LUPAL|nr:putative Gnk2-like domain-containing protein [Lupinus albus]KAF1878725.1 hypothetical protein Lal_00047396 [Lupinus albus]